MKRNLCLVALSLVSVMVLSSCSDKNSSTSGLDELASSGVDAVTSSVLESSLDTDVANSDMDNTTDSGSVADNSTTTSSIQLTETKDEKLDTSVTFDSGDNKSISNYIKAVNKNMTKLNSFTSTLSYSYKYSVNEDNIESTDSKKFDSALLDQMIKMCTEMYYDTTFRYSTKAIEHKSQYNEGDTNDMASAGEYYYNTADTNNIVKYEASSQPNTWYGHKVKIDDINNEKDLHCNILTDKMVPSDCEYTVTNVWRMFTFSYELTSDQIKFSELSSLFTDKSEPGVLVDGNDIADKDFKIKLEVVIDTEAVMIYEVRAEFIDMTIPSVRMLELGLNEQGINQELAGFVNNELYSVDVKFTNCNDTDVVIPESVSKAVIMK